MLPDAISGPGLRATVAGQTYNLNDQAAIFLHFFDLGAASIRRLSQRAPGQQGDTDLGGLSEPRYVDLAWILNGRDLDHYYTLREMMLTVFRRRNSQPVQLIFSLTGGRERATDVYLEGALDFRKRQHSQVVISGVFKANDPRLYDPTRRRVTFNLLPSAGGLPIPFTIPIPIGASSLNTTDTIVYAGGSRLAAEEWPVIAIFGQISQPVVENLTTGEQIALTANGGLAQSSSQFVVIDLSGGARRDAKTIRDQDGNSLSQYLTTDSDLASWHLAPAGELLPTGLYADGTNLIRVQGENANVNTRVVIEYYDRYEGI